MNLVFTGCMRGRWAILAALAVVGAGCGEVASEPEPEPVSEGACAVDETDCDGECVFVSSDVDHCGVCGNACATGVCSRGECADACGEGLVECNGRCIDPQIDRAFCGASADCAGDSAGTACDPDLECFEAACEARPPSCKAYLDAGRSTGDGLYAIDPDGPGGTPPLFALCDMTTDGGGWTLLGTISGGDANNWNTELGLWVDDNPVGDTDAPYDDFKSPAWYLLDLTGAEVMFERRYDGIVRAQMRLSNACVTGTTLAESFTAGGRCGRGEISAITPATDATGLFDATYMEGVGNRGLGGDGTNGWCWNGGDNNNNDFRGHAGWNSNGDGCVDSGHRGYIGVYTNGDSQFENEDITGTNWLNGTDFSLTAISLYAR